MLRNTLSPISPTSHPHPWRSGALYVILCLVFLLLPLAARGAVPDSLRITEHRWLFGLIGRQNVLDTYLSPYEYTGSTHGTLHRTERPAHFGTGAEKIVMQMSTNFSYDKSPTEDGKIIDLNITLGGGLTHDFRVTPRLRLIAGGLLEGFGGFTYNTRNGNNPAQVRLQADLAATAAAEYDFRCFHRTFRARLQGDMPLVGVMFAPHYGQSYYEILNLGNRDHNVRCTYPGNAPSFRILSTLDIPLRKITLTVGYHADIRQSYVNDLKRHGWSNQLVLGFVRHVRHVR